MRNPFKKNDKPKAEPKAEEAKVSGKVDAAEPVVEQPKEVRANPCPNCQETNWSGVSVGTQTVEKQHRCLNCGYVLTEE